MSDKYCTCDWVCDGSLHNQDGWLTPKPTITYEIVGDIEKAIRADREKLIRKIEDQICLEVHSDWYAHLSCNAEISKVNRTIKLIRTTPIGEGKHENKL